jgi:capsular exopolysaccharide synthesis family protein
MDEHLPAESAPDNWHTVDDELSLSDYLHVLRRRWGWIAVVFVATVALAVGLTLLQDAEYEADAEVLVRNATNESLFPAGSDLSTRIQREPTAEIQYIASDSFISAADTAAGFEVDIDVEIKVIDPDERIPGASGVLIFTAKASTAEAAAAAANAYADTYVELRHDDDLTAVDQLVADAQAAMATATEEREVLRAPLEDLDRRIDATSNNDVRIDLLAQRNRLADDIDADLARIDIDISRAVDDLSDVEDLADLVTDPGSAAHVNIAAEVPDSPSSPGLVRSLALAIVVGAILGLGAALLRDSLDNRVHDVGVAQRRLGLPFLGAVPVLKTARKDKGKDGPNLHLDRRGSEAFRSIRTSLRFAGPHGDSLNVFGITSAAPRDGKTVCAVYLASAFAIERGSALLIDADLRRPTVHTRTGLDGSKGLTDILSGAASIEDATQSFAGTSMNVITAGHTPGNPSELLGSAKFGLLIKELSTHYEAVVVDCPPLLAVADPRLVGTAVDGMVLVLLADSTKHSEAKRATELLRESGAHIAGFVLNQADESAGLYYDEYSRSRAVRP